MHGEGTGILASGNCHSGIIAIIAGINYNVDARSILIGTIIILLL